MEQVLRLGKGDEIMIDYIYKNQRTTNSKSRTQPKIKTSEVSKTNDFAQFLFSYTQESEKEEQKEKESSN